MKKFLLAMMLCLGISLSACLSAHAQTLTFPAQETNNTFSGTNTFNGIVNLNLATYTVSTLPNPTSVPAGFVVTVTDAMSGASCSVGSGLNLILCRNNGSMWAPLSGGSAVYPPAGIPVSTGAAWSSAAVSATITGLWTGSCNSSTYLRGDGSCQTPSGAGNVSNTGTPTNGQLAQFTNAVTIQGVTTLPTAAVPAFTGDVTNSAGSLATTVSKLNGTSLAGLATGILKNTTATGVPSIAVSSDITALWTGSCNVSTFLRGDGACAAAGGGGSITITGSPSNHQTAAWTSGTSIQGIGPGTSGYPFVSGGASADPSFAQLSLTVGVAGILPIVNGGTGTASTLIGLVRGSASAMTAAELSGDATTSGSNAVTVAKLNGTSLAGLGTGILKNTTGTGVPSIAASADVIALWSGSCSATTALLGSGACGATAAGTIIGGTWNRYGEILPYQPATDCASGCTLSGTLEPLVIYEGNPQILSAGSAYGGNVFKMWHSCGGASPGIGALCYAESYDGINWTRRATALSGLTNNQRAAVTENAGTYYLFTASNPGDSSTQVDEYTSSDGVTWTLANAAVLSIGGGGAWDHQRIAPSWVMVVGGTWYMFYDGTASGGVSWSVGVATASSPGGPWTKNAGNPIIAVNSSDLKVFQVGSTYYGWLHAVPGGLTGSSLPTDIYRFHSTNLTTWIQDTPANAPAFSRGTWDEGAGLSTGQVADPDLVQVNGRTYMYYTGTSLGTGQLNAIKMAIAPMTIATLVQTSEGIANYSFGDQFNTTPPVQFGVGSIPPPPISAYGASSPASYTGGIFVSGPNAAYTFADRGMTTNSWFSGSNGVSWQITSQSNSACLQSAPNFYYYFCVPGSTGEFILGGTPSGSGGAHFTGILGFNGSTSGVATLTGPNTAGTATNPIVSSNAISAPYYQTTTQCAAVGTTASPSVAACGAAPAGVFSCNDTSSGLCQVNTTAMISANSTVIVTQDESATTGTLLGITCHVLPSVINPSVITAKVAGTSFSFASTTEATSPSCFQYLIVN
jgi:hypothetical protein